MTIEKKMMIVFPALTFEAVYTATIVAIIVAITKKK